jgi:hypothetical protein
VSCLRIERDGMRYLDGEMRDDERVEFEKHLEGCDSCRENMQRFRELQSLTRRITMKDPADVFWESYWRSIYRRLERSIGWIFLVAGGLMLVLYALYQVIPTFKRITFEKIAIVVFVLGAVLLLVSVIRERIHQHKVDRYRDIQR